MKYKKGVSRCFIYQKAYLCLPAATRSPWAALARSIRWPEKQRSFGCRKVSRNAPPGLDTLIQKGLVETSTETNPLFAAYQILNRCILYVMDTPIQITLSPSCRRLLRWLARANCCLSAADLIRIQDLALPETPYLNGHSQERLVAALYQGITEPLETAMFQSPVFTGTMMDLLTLVHNQYIRLL